MTLAITRDPVFGCALAEGRTDRDGYVFHGKKRAHTVAWEAANGPVPDGMELDHLCRRRNCTALHHLELVTRGQNEMRKSWKRRATRKACPRGHDMATNRVVIQETSGVVCRSCNQEASESRTHQRTDHETDHV